jgi:hypothetical protein
VPLAGGKLPDDFSALKKYNPTKLKILTYLWRLFGYGEGKKEIEN